MASGSKCTATAERTGCDLCAVLPCHNWPLFRPIGCSSEWSVCCRHRLGEFERGNLARASLKIAAICHSSRPGSSSPQQILDYPIPWHALRTHGPLGLQRRRLMAWSKQKTRVIHGDQVTEHGGLTCAKRLDHVQGRAELAAQNFIVLLQAALQV